MKIVAIDIGGTKTLLTYVLGGSIAAREVWPSNFETWEEDGAKTATQRANAIWKRLLREYEKPPIDPAIEEELEAYVAQRRQRILRVT